MSSLNKVTLIGRVGKDPEIRTTQSGSRIANFNLAMSESWKDKATGEKKEKTEWIKVVCFNESLSGVIEKYVKKGSIIYVEGSLQTRKWEDKEGVTHYSTEVVLANFNGKMLMLGGKKAEEGTTAPKTDYQAPDPVDDFDDQIPF